ncbi:hypothetical protein PUN4_140103 [Paraburkholderia unamae]|nr:hypothetical protein PUN4_140103 [Paraburkholderia unamae]
MKRPACASRLAVFLSRGARLIGLLRGLGGSSPPPRAVRHAVDEGPAQHRCDGAHARPHDGAAREGERVEAEHLLGEGRQQVDARIADERAGGAHGRARRGRLHEHAHDFERALARDEFGLHRLQISGHFRARPGHVHGTEQFGNLRDFGVVLILGLARQRGIHVAYIRAEKARDLGHVHPRQQDGIARAVGAAIGRGACHGQVDLLHAFDQGQRVNAAAVGRARDEGRGAAQPPEYVGAKRGVVPHAGERERMQRLQQQRADAARHHRGEIGVDLPAYGVGAEEAGVAGRIRIIELRAAARGEMRDAFSERHAQAARELAGEAGRLGRVGRTAGVIGHRALARAALTFAPYDASGSQSPPVDASSGTVRPKWR